MADSEIEYNNSLPACIINEQLLQEIWDSLTKENRFTWKIDVGTDGDLLGIEQERPYQSMTTMEDLKLLISSLTRIDQILISINVEDKGTINLWFKNFARATGRIKIIGQEADWVKQKSENIMVIMNKYKQEVTTMLYGKLIYALINTIFPFILAFILVFFVTAFILRGHIHSGEVVWWLAAINILISFKLASILSNYFLKLLLLNYPYVKWDSLNNTMKPA